MEDNELIIRLSPESLRKAADRIEQGGFMIVPTTEHTHPGMWWVRIEGRTE